MKNLKLLSIVVGFASLVIVGCKKGDTGPKGNTGPAGPDSVLHSSWISLNMTQQVDNANDTTYFQSITAPALTSSILDSGVVLSYIGIPGSGTNGTDTAVFSISEASTYYGAITQQLLVGEIDLLAVIDFTNVLYRYVFIPGTILTNGIGGTVYTKQQLKAMTYSDLQKKLGQTASINTTN